MKARAYVANVIGENLIDLAMPVEEGHAPIRPVAEEPLLVLYGDTETGVTVAVVGVDEDRVERTIQRVWPDAYIDCIDLSANQDPQEILQIAGMPA